MTEPLSNLPENYRRYANLPASDMDAHHRPPNVFYDEHGRPVHFTIGQPPPPQNIVVQLPEQDVMSRQQREFMMYALIWLVVAVVLTGCACAVTVICGGTLMGIIGVVGQNATMLAVSLVGVILAAGWAATKIRPAAKSAKKRGR
ncbi:hypothetical protein ACFYZB_04290 [Streptomyces sp. NPDC001852]|uniref:hypothetical protein n=1 Tax=Streptomyces sp. NPDC001852 TaxID=3364619 RepID=UPI003680B99A